MAREDLLHELANLVALHADEAARYREEDLAIP